MSEELFDGGKAPGYFRTLEPYLRAFRAGNLPPYSPGMPGDERIIRAIYRVFQWSDHEQRAVMEGTSRLPMHERKMIRLEILAQIAQEAKLTHSHVPYAEEESIDAER